MSKQLDKKEEAVERSGPSFNPPVYLQRYTTVRDLLYKLPGIVKVVDFGCAEGKFIKYLKKLPFVTELSCVDVCGTALEWAGYAARPVAWDYVFKRHEPLTIRLYKGSALESDCRLNNYSAVTCIELIEHMQPEDLPPLMANIFGYIRPKVAVFTTPNSDFNVLFPNLEGFRHWDHKFEWTREEFRKWCDQVLSEYPDYTVEVGGIGDPPDESVHLGHVTQFAVFSLKLEYANVQNDNFVSSEERYKLLEEHFYPGRTEKSEDVI